MRQVNTFFSQGSIFFGNKFEMEEDDEDQDALFSGLWFGSEIMNGSKFDGLQIRWSDVNE